MMCLVDHAQATELFSAYWERELGETEKGALEEHLRTCVVCRREFQSFEQTVNSVGSLHKMVAPPDFAEAVRTKIRKRSRGRFFSPRKLAERIPYELFSLVMLGLISGHLRRLAAGQPQPAQAAVCRRASGVFGVVEEERDGQTVKGLVARLGDDLVDDFHSRVV